MSGLINKLVEFEEYYDIEDTFIRVGPATFKKRFGPWDKDYVALSLTLDYSRGILEEINDNGDIINKVNVKLIEA